MKKSTLIHIVANSSEEDQIFLKKYLELKDSNPGLSHLKILENLLKDLGIEDDSLPWNSPKYSEKLSARQYNHLIYTASQVSKEVADELNSAKSVQCPKCDEGILKYTDGCILESLPPQRNVHCTSCGHRDYITHFGFLYGIAGPKDPLEK